MRAGELTISLPGEHSNTIKYVVGMINMYRNRISIIEEKTKENMDYPSEWCSIRWAKEEESPPSVNWKECIELGCIRVACSETGYCSKHSLYR